MYTRKQNSFDSTVNCKVEVKSTKFLNPFDTDGYKLFEYEFIPVISKQLRKELEQRFNPYPFLKKVFDRIDFIYSSCFWNSASEILETRLKSYSDDREGLKFELENLITRQSEIYPMFTTTSRQNINFFLNFESLINSLPLDSSPNLNFFIGDSNATIGGEILEPASKEWTSLFDCIKNLAYNNFINLIKKRIKKKKNISYIGGIKFIKINYKEFTDYLINDLKLFVRKDRDSLHKLFSGDIIHTKVNFNDDSKRLITLFYHLKDGKFIINTKKQICGWINRYYLANNAEISALYVEKLMKPGSTQRISDQVLHDGTYLQAEFINYKLFIEKSGT